MAKENFSRRLGRFTITLETIDKSPASVMAVMGTVIVVRAEVMYSSNSIKYEAISDLFDEIDQAAEPPVYSIGIEVPSYSVTFTKQE